MSQKPLEMNRIKQVQQLAADGVSKKEIKRRTGISLKTIRKYLRKLAACEPDSDAPRSGYHRIRQRFYSLAGT